MKAVAQPLSQRFSEKKKPGEGTGPLAALNFESEGPGSCFAVVLFP